ncbi:hypothetical protein ACFY30_18820 [Streptomyces sp. NPDC000345]|uniref:hypothetical protein n=1 Tax=Streptomyces sp. NPDC000345 TaxID=3364537 RepID=UPI00369366A2
MPVPAHHTVRRLLGAAGLAVVAAVVTAGAVAPPATAAAAPAVHAASPHPSRAAAAPQAPAAAPRTAADFRHWGGSYSDRASAEAAGALLMLAGTAAAYVVEYVQAQGPDWVLWYW